MDIWAFLIESTQQCANWCIVEGEAQKSPFFWRLSQVRLFSRNSSGASTADQPSNQTLKRNLMQIRRPFLSFWLITSRSLHLVVVTRFCNSRHFMVEFLSIVVAWRSSREGILPLADDQVAWISVFPHWSWVPHVEPIPNKSPQKRREESACPFDLL